MQDIAGLYKLWSENPYFSEETREELLAIAGDETEIRDRFFKYLEFGTGGLRGIIGAGTNRMNVYTVALATEAFARYVESDFAGRSDKSIAVSYDSRHFSKEFAMLVARVFAGHGIKVYLSDALRPTPMLSFAVRHFKTVGGVMVTASHNPPNYNGYKAYGEDGGQMPPHAADQVLDHMAQIEDITSLSWMDEEEAFDKGLIEYFGSEFDQAYYKVLADLTINPEVIEQNKDMKIVFTPLHGTGYKPVTDILAKVGFEQVHIVKEQSLPDPDFSTVASPNPEEEAALSMALDLAKSIDAELVMATDPDGDRLGVAVRQPDGSFAVLSGNQIGLLLMEYILGAKQRAGALNDGSFVVTTIVSSKLSSGIAKAYDVKLFEVLTGFKYIAEIIKDYDENGDMSFEFGFEESYGYLAGKDVRDKDAVVAVMLAAEMAAYARSCSKTLYDFLEDIYKKYGYAAEKTISIHMAGREGNRQIRNIMEGLREGPVSSIGDIAFKSLKDYREGLHYDFEKKSTEPMEFDKSNVLLYSLGGDDWFCVRPSGTEPKLKVYFGFYGSDPDECEKRLEDYAGRIEEFVRSLA